MKLVGTKVQKWIGVEVHFKMCWRIYCLLYINLISICIIIHVEKTTIRKLLNLHKPITSTNKFSFIVSFCVSGCHQASDEFFLKVLDFHLFFLLLHYISNYFETIAQSVAFSWTSHAPVMSEPFSQCLIPQLALQ